CQHYWSTPWTF
nr:immunoglobulin light chain junction region [Mus musculus]